MNPEILDRLPPSDPDAEKRVLYAMIVDPKRQIDKVTDAVSADDFYDGRNKVLFASLTAMHVEGRDIGGDTLAIWLNAHGKLEDAGGLAWIGDVMSVAYVRLDTAVDIARVVRDHSSRRTIVRTAETMLRSAWNFSESVAEALEAAESALGTIQLGTASEALVDGPTAAMMFTDHVDAVMERGKHCGIMTGLWKFDDTFGGLLPGEYAILAADSSAGKTSLGAQMADFNAERGRLVYVASLEMEAVEYTQRLVCAIAEVNSRHIRTRRLSQEDRAKLADGAAKFARRAIRIDPRTDLKVTDIRRASRRLLRDGLSLVMVDYLGLVEPDDYRANREQQVARISRGLKNLAKELNVPVLALCQLNREKATAERPQLRNLRESGAIGNDAHMVLFLHKPPDRIVDVEWYKDSDGTQKKRTVQRDWPAELILAKNRNGETGAVRLDWIPEYTRFECWDRAAESTERADF